jgi:hypothetical protein
VDEQVVVGCGRVTPGKVEDGAVVAVGFGAAGFFALDVEAEDDELASAGDDFAKDRRALDDLDVGRLGVVVGDAHLVAVVVGYRREAQVLVDELAGGVLRWARKFFP